MKEENPKIHDEDPADAHGSLRDESSLSPMDESPFTHSIEPAFEASQDTFIDDLEELEIGGMLQEWEIEIEDLDELENWEGREAHTPQEKTSCALCIRLDQIRNGVDNNGKKFSEKTKRNLDSWYRKSWESWASSVGSRSTLEGIFGDDLPSFLEGDIYHEGNKVGLINERTLRKHWRYFHDQQPSTGGLLEASVIQGRWDDLPQRHQEIMHLINRVGQLSTTMIAQMFYTPIGEKVNKSRVTQAGRDLHYLASMHFLYRWYPREEDRDGPLWPRSWGRCLWMLGTRGQGVLERAGEKTGRPNRPQEKRSTRGLEHDLRVLSLLITSSQGKKVSWPVSKDGSRKLDGSLYGSILNFRSERALSMGYRDPFGESYKIMPDGFNTMIWQPHDMNSWAHYRTQDNSFTPALGTTLLPFFLEYDRGVKDGFIVGKQIMSYIAAWMDGAPGRLFEGIELPPVFFVFKTRQALERARREARKIARKWQDMGIDIPHLPIFLTIETLWERNLNEGEIMIHAWEDFEKAQSWFEILYTYNRPIWQTGFWPQGKKLVPLTGSVVAGRGVSSKKVAAWKAMIDRQRSGGYDEDGEEI